MISRKRITELENIVLDKIETCLSAINSISNTENDEHAAKAVEALVSVLSEFENLKRV